MIKPEKWSDPSNKLFAHQVGLTAPPMDFDAAPTDFPRICPPSVGVHGRLLHAPAYALSQRADNFRSTCSLTSNRWRRLRRAA